MDPDIVDPTVGAPRHSIKGDGMAILRVLGRLCLILAALFVALGIFIWLDGRTAQNAGLAWRELHLASLSNLEVFVTRYLGLPDLWYDWVLPYLGLPAWEAALWPVIVFLILGGLFSLLGRKGRRKGVFR
jgi:hypothetical protein